MMTAVHLLKNADTKGRSPERALARSIDNCITWFV